MRVIGVGLRKPKDTRLGVDFAGTVEAVGKNVTKFKPGDEVFGGRTGAFAEYVCVREPRAVALKPANITFEQAASVPIAAITALQGVRDKGKVQPGQKVLINGASGGVGTFAVQIAKSFGADVTGVCSTRNLDMVRSLGADHVIDYTKEDFTKGAERYDVIIDNVANHSLLECRARLKAKRDLRPDRRRQCKRTRFDRTFDQSDQGNVVIPVCKPKNGHVAGRPKPQRFGLPGRSHAERKGETSHRQNLQVERCPRGYQICGARSRSRKSRHNC